MKMKEMLLKIRTVENGVCVHIVVARRRRRRRWCRAAFISPIYVAAFLQKNQAINCKWPIQSKKCAKPFHAHINGTERKECHMEKNVWI